MIKNFIILLSAFYFVIAINAKADETNAIAPTAPEQEETLIDNKIYFFAHSMCQTCRITYEYLSNHHRDLNIGITDMKFHHNFELYKQCVKKFGIANSELRLPLICMGDNYIMGWDNTSPTRFRAYLKSFLERQSTANKD